MTTTRRCAMETMTTYAHDQEVPSWLLELLNAGLELVTLVKMSIRDRTAHLTSDGCNPERAALLRWARAVVQARKACAAAHRGEAAP